jgi:hypothetical protein
VTRIRRGGYVFVTWAGDHSPRHVHVFRDGTHVLKWDLDAGGVMEGRASSRLIATIRTLVREGRL